MTTPTPAPAAPRPLSDRERIDLLLDRITELEGALAGARDVLAFEQEAHRHTRENFESFAKETGMIVTERGEAEEIVLVARQFVEGIKDSDSKARTLETIKMLRDGLREPLPREIRLKRKWAAD